MRAKRNRMKIYTLAILCLLTVVFYAAVQTPCGVTSFRSLLLYPHCDDKYKEIMCYENDSGNVMDELSLSRIRINMSIWFVETTCVAPGGSPKISVRQACAIESAARLNPGRDVYLLFPSPIYNLEFMNKPIMRALLSYENIHLRHTNLSKMFYGTPLLSRWITERAGLKTSRWPQSHASDILRYTLLWKYGGVYVDLDVIFFKSFDGLGNFAGAESQTAIAAGVVSLGHGTKPSNLCILDIKYDFRGNDWGNNGPGVITRVMKKLCHEEEVPKMFGKTCSNVTVAPPHVFYPIPWQKWRLYFTEKEEEASEVMRIVNSSIGVHVWNSHSHGTAVWKGSRQPYVRMMSEHCPSVYSAIPDTAIF